MSEVPKLNFFFDLALRHKIDNPHQTILTMILQNPVLAMVKIENKEVSFAELCILYQSL